MYEIINILWILMQIAGPTPVAGTSGTTAAFLGQSNRAIERSHRVR